jgi:GH15 family glucan-1,4-alpha-glucosidase
MDNLDYGVIGNGQSAALVSKDGSIDWLCLPSFDAGSVFARVLDADQGGFFAVVPEGGFSTEQKYIRRTNILSTVFRGEDWSFEMVDFMPRYIDQRGIYHHPPDIIRVLKPRKPKAMVKVVFDPRINFAEFPTEHAVNEQYIKCYSTGGAYESVYLYSSIPLDVIHERRPFLLEKPQYLVLSYNQKIAPLTMDHIDLEFERTKVYWMGWISKTPSFDKYQDEIERSTLVLKLLAYQKTGAILAAVTTSLPETIGEARNWDYRFCWIRDASMTIRILNRLKHANVANRFLQFILNIIPYKDERIQIMYGINGQRELKERELDWLEGYERSRPVRIGNDAYVQKQNDIYGSLMDMIYEYLILYHSTMHNREDVWTVVRTLARHVARHWREPDHSIWEFRSDIKHYTFSKVLSWVALDRAAKIAGIFHKDDYAKEWNQLAETIKADILLYGWNEEMGTFTQAYNGTNYDAANLLIEHYGFLDASDPCYVSTVKKTYEGLCKNGLMYRYLNKDDFGVPQSSFIICTFWMIKSLYRIGEKDLARSMFDDILRHSNHLGLFSEDMDVRTKRLLGNFPQGYSHLALIDVALTLNEMP